MKHNKRNRGFTMIELLVSVAVISVLSMIVLFSIGQYVNKGKDSNIAGNLVVLIPAGEAYYNVQNTAYGNGYTGFCSSPTVTNIFSQLAIPNPPYSCADDPTHPGLCCNVSLVGDAWAACAQKFTDTAIAYCVDSRGFKRDICSSSCTGNIDQCPTDVLSSCE